MTWGEEDSDRHEEYESDDLINWKDKFVRSNEKKGGIIVATLVLSRIFRVTWFLAVPISGTLWTEIKSKIDLLYMFLLFFSTINMSER